jgi:hypothetical protein
VSAPCDRSLLSCNLAPAKGCHWRSLNSSDPCRLLVVFGWGGMVVAGVLLVGCHCRTVRRPATAFGQCHSLIPINQW